MNRLWVRPSSGTRTQPSSTGMREPSRTVHESSRLPLRQPRAGWCGAGQCHALALQGVPGIQPGGRAPRTQIVVRCRMPAGHGSTGHPLVFGPFYRSSVGFFLARPGRRYTASLVLFHVALPYGRDREEAPSHWLKGMLPVRLGSVRRRTLGHQQSLRPARTLCASPYRPQPGVPVVCLHVPQDPTRSARHGDGDVTARNTYPAHSPGDAGRAPGHHLQPGVSPGALRRFARECERQPLWERMGV